jgi:hypothetical protein
MDQIVQALLLSDHPDSIKQQYLDHILATASLTLAQQQSIADVLWAAWPENQTTPPPSLLVIRALQHPSLSHQFLPCVSRYLKTESLTPDQEHAYFLWMTQEKRPTEWRKVLLMLILYLAWRNPSQLSRVYRILQECPGISFSETSSGITSAALNLDSNKKAEVLIKCGRVPMIGYMGPWLRQFILLLVQGSEWIALVKGGTDILLSVSEQLTDDRTVHGALVVLETIFLGYQENANVFLGFFSHVFDRMETFWFHDHENTSSSSLSRSCISLERATLIRLHQFLLGLMFAFPGHPLHQARMQQLCTRLPPCPPTFHLGIFIGSTVS